MNRAGFLKSLALGGAGLIVGGDLIEEMARRFHVRKSFPSALLNTPVPSSIRHLSSSTYPNWMVGDHVAVISSGTIIQQHGIVTGVSPLVISLNHPPSSLLLT